MHTFIDDRIVDKQHRLSPAEIVLAKQAALLAQRIARESSLLSPPVERLWFDGFDSYHAAQLRSYDQPTGETSEGTLDTREKIVTDRAALGQLGVVAACHAAGRADLRTAFSGAFNDLAIGLQWEDDLMDWPGDLAANQPNLLLAGLPPSAIASDGGDIVKCCGSVISVIRRPPSDLPRCFAPAVPRQ